MAKPYELVWRTHGGARPGAGRPPKGDVAGEPHRRRPPHYPAHPVHVIVKVARGLPSLRDREVVDGLREATFIALRREDFRIVRLIATTDTLELLIEADTRHAITRGMRGFQIAVTSEVKNVLFARTGERRKGVFPDRYRERALTTAAEVDEVVARFAAAPRLDLHLWPPRTVLLFEGLARH